MPGSRKKGQKRSLSQQKLYTCGLSLWVCIGVTLQVRERVQGRLVSGSWTPQCLLGSNTLPVKQKTHFVISSFPSSSINSHLERMPSSNTSAILICLFFRQQLALSTHSMVSQSFSHGPRLLYSNTIICVPLLAMLLVSNRYTVQIPHAVINHSWQNTLAAWQESTGTGSPAKLSPALTSRIRVGVYFDGCYSSMIFLP